MQDNVALMAETIRYIEEHMEDELTAERVAEHFHYSIFHYTRLFKEVMGESLGLYQRKRRLTLAAEQLWTTNRGIIDIAMDYGYHSQEAFTRMFKNYFGVNPRAYRKGEFPLLNLYKYPMTEQEILKMLTGPALSYDIVHKDAYEITGLFYHGNNQKHEVSRVFNQAVKSLHFEQIYDLVDGLYGLECCHNRAGAEEFDFIAGVDSSFVSEVEPEVVKRSVPANDYAVFTLSPMIEQIHEQIHKIYLQFLKQQEYELCDEYAYEYYPKGFIPNQKECIAYLYLPVRKL